MTKQHVISLWTKGELDHSAFLLYSYIYLKGNPQNQYSVTASAESLMRFLNIAYPKLKKATQSLEKLHILKVKKGFSNQPNTYMLLLEQVRSSTPMHSPTALRRRNAFLPNIKYYNIKTLTTSSIIDKNKFKKEN